MLASLSWFLTPRKETLLVLPLLMSVRARGGAEGGSIGDGIGVGNVVVDDRSGLMKPPPPMAMEGFLDDSTGT